ncbi:CoA-binding protein [Candidatus Margulisiibacteriota bacterium]
MSQNNTCSLPLNREVLPAEYQQRWQNPETIQQILRDYKTIAIVGISPKEDRPSNMVGAYLIAQGFEVIPVNPREQEILGLPCYPSLSDIPHPVDIVNIFRRPDMVLPIVEEAIAIKAKAVWFQLTVINLEAGRLAEENGLAVVMDRCLKVEHEFAA